MARCSGEFSLYDHVLDHSAMFNVVPPRYRGQKLSPLDVFFAGLIRITTTLCPSCRRRLSRTSTSTRRSKSTSKCRRDNHPPRHSGPTLVYPPRKESSRSLPHLSSPLTSSRNSSRCISTSSSFSTRRFVAFSAYGC